MGCHNSKSKSNLQKQIEQADEKAHKETKTTKHANSDNAMVSGAFTPHNLNKYFVKQYSFPRSNQTDFQLKEQDIQKQLPKQRFQNQNWKSENVLIDSHLQQNSRINVYNSKNNLVNPRNNKQISSCNSIYAQNRSIQFYQQLSQRNESFEKLIFGKFQKTQCKESRHQKCIREGQNDSQQSYYYAVSNISNAPIVLKISESPLYRRRIEKTN